MDKLNNRIKIAEEHQKLLDDYNREEADSIQTKWETEISNAKHNGHHEVSFLCDQALKKIVAVKDSIQNERLEIDLINEQLEKERALIRQLKSNEEALENEDREYFELTKKTFK